MVQKLLAVSGLEEKSIKKINKSNLRSRKNKLWQSADSAILYNRPSHSTGKMNAYQNSWQFHLHR